MRALVVGTGVGVRTHLPSLVDALGPEQIGLVSRDPRKAQTIINQPLGYFGSHLRKALAEWRPDLVTIGVPNNLHVSVVADLAGFPGAVLMEKPVGLSLEECERVSTTLAGVRAFTNFQLRGLPPFRAIRDRIQDGHLGDLFLIRVDERSEAFFTASEDAWYFRSSQGGGQRFAMLTHLVDLIGFLTTARGRGRSAKATILPEPRPALEHSVACQYQLDDVAVVLTSSAAARGRRSFSLEVLGSSGRVYFEFTDGRGTCEVSTQEGRSVLWEHAGDQPSLFRVAFPYYLRAVLQCMGPAAEAQEANGVLATLDDAMGVHRLLGGC